MRALQDEIAAFVPELVRFAHQVGDGGRAMRAAIESEALRTGLSIDRVYECFTACIAVDQAIALARQLKEQEGRNHGHQE